MPEHAWTQRPPSKGTRVCANWVPVPFCCGEAGQAWFTALNHLPFPRCWLLSPAEYVPHPFIVENLLFLLVFLLKTPAYLKPPWWLSGKEPACQCRTCTRCTLAPCLGKIPGGGTATHSGLLAGDSHGHKRLTGYSLWGRKKSDTAEQLNNKASTQQTS